MSPGSTFCEQKVVGASQPAASGWIIAFQCGAENEKCVFVTASQRSSPGALFVLFCWKIVWDYLSLRLSTQKKLPSKFSVASTKFVFDLFSDFSTLKSLNLSYRKISFAFCLESSINLNEVCVKLPRRCRWKVLFRVSSRWKFKWETTPGVAVEKEMLVSLCMQAHLMEHEDYRSWEKFNLRDLERQQKSFIRKSCSGKLCNQV